MIKLINDDNLVFKNEMFIKDEVLFNLFFRIKDSENHLFFMNDKNNVIIGQSSANMPMWCWTSDDISKEELKEIKKFFKQNITEKSKPNVVLKIDLLDFAKDIFGKKIKNINYMTAHHCLKINDFEEAKGHMRLANDGDVMAVASYIVGFELEIGKRVVPIEAVTEDAKNFINTGKLYVWENEDGKVVSMACLSHESDKYIRINSVFTDKNMRSKGYVKSLIKEICEIIKEKGKIPMLYTDTFYPASNKAYKAAGFEETGKIFEIIML